MAAASPEQPIFPISEISSYQSGWTIKARVTSRGPTRTFSKGTSQGKVFHVELLDSRGGEIRASFFNDGAEQFDAMMKPGKIFTFRKGSVRIANKQYNNLSHKYELVFDKGAEIVEAAEDAAIEAVKWSFTDLRVLQSKTLPCRVDLCGVITSFKPTYAFTSQAGADLVKREITIADDTATSLDVVLFGERATIPDSKFEGHPIISLKGIVVKEFNGSRTGSLIREGDLVFGTERPEAKRVEQWWAKGGSSQTIAALSQSTAGVGSTRSRNAKQCAGLADLRMALENCTEQAEYYSVVARLSLVQMQKAGEPQPLHYMACAELKPNSTLTCNRRVDSSGFCASCGKAGKVATRLNLRCKFSDGEDSLFLTTFHEAAEQVVAMKAQEVQALEAKAGSREELETAIRAKYFTTPVQLLVKGQLQTYNGELRPNSSCLEARPVSRKEHARRLLAEIATMLAAPPTAGA